MLSSRAAGVQRTYGARSSVRAWLAWLAGAMQRHDQTIFYVDRVQPDWLEEPTPPWLARWAAMAIAALLHLLVVAMAAAVTVGAAVLLGGHGGLPQVLGSLLAPRLWPLVLLALAGSLALAPAVHDSTIEPVRWSREAFQRTLPGGAARGALAAHCSARRSRCWSRRASRRCRRWQAWRRWAA